ncbi:MAG TPA: type VI secretion system baseplate subunit TssF [Blastocatellia bacterium]
MRDELLGYYERELSFLRQMGAEFAQKYPKIAGRLSLPVEPDRCEDPHVERMIEAFAFLSARIRLKVDDEFPEITESLLNVLYPHYLAPIPSMSIVQFSLDAAVGKLTTGYRIDRGTVLYSKPVHGVPCRFRTGYATTLWPIEVVSASLQSSGPADSKGKCADAAIKIRLRCINDTRLSELHLTEEDGINTIDRLRFFISGEAQSVYPLYEILFNNATRVELRPGAEKKKNARERTPSPISLPASSLKPVGFEASDAMLPQMARSFPGYRLLAEYFAFPEKFLFVDVTGLDAAAREGFGEEFDILIHLRDVTPPPGEIDQNTFQLGCTPIINLFTKMAEPVQLTQQQHEYRVIPDVHRQMATEVYSIDSVATVDPSLQQSRSFKPFYYYGHSDQGEVGDAFWYGTRRESQKKDDPGSEVYLSLVDLKFNPHVPAVDTLIVRTTCTNRDLPAKLPFGGMEGDFESETAGPISRVRCLKKPTPSLRPPMRRGAHWRLISHLSLNHLSITSAGENGAPDPLREILLLYDFMDSAATRKQISGLIGIDSRVVVRQMGSRIGAGFVRGTETTLEFDGRQYVGSGVFLFASVIERFLALYASMNSFSQLVAKVKQREGYLKRWAPRAGARILL